MTEPDARPPRTALIADAAVTLIAQQGLRALTHRAVDRAAGIPEGSTSYYAPPARHCSNSPSGAWPSAPSPTPATPSRGSKRLRRVRPRPSAPNNSPPSSQR
ncbi:TetR family transcriptional regulator [Prescottella defluvii]|nr:TetR family transcriptional regulator [Prescottella defluvii]